MSANAKEDILAAARQVAQTRGYNGLNFRDLAADVGIKAASIYYHFPSKADLGAAVAKRYHEDTAVSLDALGIAAGDPVVALRNYPEIFRPALKDDNRMCLASFMAAEHDALPDAVGAEVEAFANINVEWLAKCLSDAKLARGAKAEKWARAIYAAVAGGQLIARSRSNPALFDEIIESYRSVGLLPGK